VLTLAELPARERARRLAGPGLRLRTGPLLFSIRSVVPEVVVGLVALYGEHPVEEPGGFADFHVSVDRPFGVRRWLRSQVFFGIDGDSPYAPLPGAQGLPMLEWGMNWCVTSHCHQYLILHAAVLERHGRALVMPAPSGSGKSTLCAALLHRGWRLLSDELAIIEPATGRLVPMPRAVSLKNASIQVIQRFAGDTLRFGSIVHDTIKGSVGHFAAPADAVRLAQETAAPGLIVFPRYQADAPVSVTALPRGQALMQLIENAFNYNVHRLHGFDMLADLAQASCCYRFSYSDLGQATAMLGDMADRLPMPP
jgi:hypothetical protein